MSIMYFLFHFTMLYIDHMSIAIGAIKSLDINMLSNTTMKYNVMYVWK